MVYHLQGDSGSPIVAKHSGPDGFTVYPLFLLFTKGIEGIVMKPLFMTSICVITEC